MREVEEKRPVAIGLNDLDRLIGPVVGEVTTWFKQIDCAAVVGIGVGEGGPQKLINRIKVEFGVHYVRMIFGQVQAARHQQTFIKTLFVGRHAVLASEMPLADVHGVVTARFQRFSKGDFLRRQPLKVIRRLSGRRLGVIQSVGRCSIHIRSDNGHRSTHGRRHGRISKACSAGISARHQHGSGGRTC